MRPPWLRVFIADERKPDRRICGFDGRRYLSLCVMPVNWGNALERDMIKIKDEILYVMIWRFLVSERIHPSLEINSIHPNNVATLRVSNVDVSLFLSPIVHSHPAHGRRLGRWRWCR